MIVQRPTLSIKNSQSLHSRANRQDPLRQIPVTPFSLAMEITSSSIMVSDTCVSSPVVAVVGVGYVGEHLVLEFSKHYPTIAYDIDARRLDQISQHKTTHQLMTTRDPSDLRLATHILISVPTGVFHDGAINVEILRNAVATVVRNARFGATIVVESSVAVGMTRDLFGDIYLERELKIGMSPEVSSGSSSYSCLSIMLTFL